MPIVPWSGCVSITWRERHIHREITKNTVDTTTPTVRLAPHTAYARNDSTAVTSSIMSRGNDTVAGVKCYPPCAQRNWNMRRTWVVFKHRGEILKTIRDHVQAEARSAREQNCKTNSALLAHLLAWVWKAYSRFGSIYQNASYETKWKYDRSDAIKRNTCVLDNMNNVEERGR